MQAQKPDDKGRNLVSIMSELGLGFVRPVAERVGFEPTVPFQARRISSAVHSTTLPPLRGADIAWSSEGLL